MTKKRKPLRRPLRTMASSRCFRSLASRVVPHFVRRHALSYAFSSTHGDTRLRYETVGGYTLTPFDTHRCIFVHVPKTAGISVARSLFGNLAGGHRTIRDYQAIFSEEEFATYFKFSFVRNPFTRLLSAFSYLLTDTDWPENQAWAQQHLAGYGSFDEFVLDFCTPESVFENIHFYPQSCFLEGVGKPPGQSMPLDFVGRFEQLEEGFSVVCSRLGIDRRLRHVNATARTPIPAALSRGAITRIQQAYASDFDRFQYSLEPPTLLRPA